MRKELIIKCPHCLKENGVMWDIEKDGSKLHCAHCGKLIAAIEEDQEKTNIREKAYERFKLWWTLTHGYTIKELGALVYNHIEACKNDYTGTLDEYIQETGFAGANIWPCFNEFMDCEYQDANLMYLLLDPEDYQTYLNAEGIEEPDHLGDTIKVTTPHGEIVAYDNNDSDYPGISLFFVKKGEDREGPGGVMEFTSCYSPSENATEVTDMVQFRFYPKENPYDEPSHIFALE